VSISIALATLGGEIKVPGIYEDHLLKIPAGTQSHQRFRLAGKGVKRLQGSGSGDHYVHVKIKIPTKLTTEQKKLVMSLAELDKDAEEKVEGASSQTKSTDKPKEEEVGFFKKIKRALFD